MMNTNINLALAINQMRQARKAGKISGKVQARILRRIGFEMNPNTERWGQMMKLRATIHKEIDPKIKRDEDESDTNSKVYISKRINKPKLDTFDCTSDWWNFQEQLDRTQGKIETLEDKPFLNKSQRKTLCSLKLELQGIKNEIEERSKKYNLTTA